MRLVDLIRRGWNKPPHVIARWLWRQLMARRTAKVLPGWERWLGAATMAAAVDAGSVDNLFRVLRGANPFPALGAPAKLREAVTGSARDAILDRADRAMRRQVDFLGSGPTQLGDPIDWALDFKSNTRWDMAPSRRLPVNDLKNPSDIKVIWELSRLQWLLPVGQAYVLEGDERYAAFVRDIIDEWIAANPVCRGPNWMCAMDVALRAISVAWLFHACKDADIWQDRDFQERLCKFLILHGKFIDGNLEYADVNGNHLTADLAGLTVIGVALGGGGIAKRWIERAWRLLSEELPKQVPEDGVCREASAPYHRLVAELFLLPMLARRNVGLPVADDYAARLASMAEFTVAATGPDGLIPVWGDADDGRALALGGQDMNDHRYLAEILSHLDEAPASPAHDETLWWLGVGGAYGRSAPDTPSRAFTDAGVYVLRGGGDQVFVDAGPVGMAGRGGHGHNDCLSFEAALMGERLIVDPGCYVYTADWQARNWFRGTEAHNSPMIDGAEINRMPRPEWLWYLADDAQPEIRHWSTSADVDMLCAAHSGYRRLVQPVTPVRCVLLEKSAHRLIVADGFEGEGEHDVRITHTFAPGIAVEAMLAGVWRLKAGDTSFRMILSAPDDWDAELGNASFSPSYGVRLETAALSFRRQGTLRPLVVAVIPDRDAPPDPVRWLTRVVEGRLPVPGIKP